MERQGRTVLLWVSAFASLLFCISTEGAVYKCPATSGGFTYSDKPCPDALRKEGREWVNVEEEKRKKREEDEARARQIQLERERDQQKLRAEREAEEAARRARESEWERERQRAINYAKGNGLYVIEYVVEGSASSAGLTYNNETGGTEQQKVPLPWRKLITVSRGYFAYISAQNQGAYGSITVTILLNGVPVKSSKSSGEYGIASASGRI